MSWESPPKPFRRGGCPALSLAACWESQWDALSDVANIALALLFIYLNPVNLPPPHFIGALISLVS